jgi:hypothetical protein
MGEVVARCYCRGNWAWGACRPPEKAPFEGEPVQIPRGNDQKPWFSRHRHPKHRVQIRAQRVAWTESMG